MYVKSLITAVMISTVAATANAGGLLNAEQRDDVTPLPVAAQPSGSLRGSIIPIALGVGALALLLGGTDSGGGTAE